MGEEQKDLEKMCGGWYEGAWFTCWMVGVQGYVDCGGTSYGQTSNPS